MADHTVLIKRLRRVGEDGCDPDLPHDAADALEAQAREIEALRKTAANAEGMAESMCMFREDMLGAGVISKGVPPMFMTEAVMSFIGDLRREIEALRADAGVVALQRDSLRGALQKVLDTRNAEAKAAMSAENARDNFSSHHREMVSYERAMFAASDAECEAQTLLLTLKEIPRAPMSAEKGVAS